jgi:hypothetical protein
MADRVVAPGPSATGGLCVELTLEEALMVTSGLQLFIDADVLLEADKLLARRLIDEIHQLAFVLDRCGRAVRASGGANGKH